jgi:hypothetical protein
MGCHKAKSCCCHQCNCCLPDKIVLKTDGTSVNSSSQVSPLELRSTWNCSQVSVNTLTVLENSRKLKITASNFNDPELLDLFVVIDRLDIAETVQVVGNIEVTVDLIKGDRVSVRAITDLPNPVFQISLKITK